MKVPIKDLDGVTHQIEVWEYFGIKLRSAIQLLGIALECIKRRLFYEARQMIWAAGISIADAESCLL